MKFVILFLAIGLSSLEALPQCPGDTLTLVSNHPYKIKATTGVSSQNARVADYVEFQTMVPIFSTTGKEVIAKETSIFGIVTYRKHRNFPLRNGGIELALQPIMTWDGQAVEIAIARHVPLRSRPGNEKAEGRNVRCGDGRENCVAGRLNPSVAEPIIAGVSTAGGAAVASFAKDEEFKFIAWSGFFSIAEKVGNLLAGTDAGISANEIFDMHLKSNTTVCVPKAAEPKS